MHSNVKRLLSLLLAATGMMILSVSHAQNRKPTEDSTTTSTARRDSVSVSKPRPYQTVITAKAITDEGLFKCHKVDNRYYFEIPDSLLNTDILIVNRVKKAANPTGPRQM